MPTLEIEPERRVYWEALPEKYTSLGRISDLAILRVQLPDSTVDLLRYLPEGWKAGIGYFHGHVAPEKKEVRLETPSGVEWLATTMHEIGHVEEERQTNFSIVRHDRILLDFQW